MSSSCDEVVTPETVKRISRDIRNIMKNPLHDNGIYYEHNMENIFKGYAMIIGPKDTPYQDGFFFFEFNFPSDYPHSPPKLRFLSNGDNIRFNPNLYRDGKVCISLLNTWRGDQWTSCQSISTVLLTLCTVLNETPLLNEPGINSSNPEIELYNTIISYKNIDVCILKMIENIKNDSLPYSMFKDVCFNHFKENRDRIINNVTNIELYANEINKRNTRGDISTNIYKMSVKINKTTSKKMISSIKRVVLG